VKRLDALRDSAPKDTVLSEIATEASDAIEQLVGYYIEETMPEHEANE
jgi:hypothetical protein